MQEQFISTYLALILPFFIAFQIKHFLCDFVLQTKWIAKEKGVKYIPLLIHSGTHGLGTLLILLYLAPKYWYLCFLDCAVHAIIDRLRIWLILKAGEQGFWMTLGADQMAHHLFHYSMIWFVLS